MFTGDPLNTVKSATCVLSSRIINGNAVPSAPVLPRVASLCVNDAVILSALIQAWLHAAPHTEQALVRVL